MTEKTTKKQQKPNVPNLRFPGFEGKWTETAVEDILKIGSGKDYKHLKTGPVPVFGTGGQMTSVNDYLHDGETVCIGRKGTINKPFYYKGKLWTVDTLFYTHSFNNIYPKFLLYIFQRINWLQHNEASGVPSLSKSTIEQIIISIPSLDEQSKIATLLSLIDDRITTQNKIIEELKSFNKSIVDKLFNYKYSKSPGAPWSHLTYGDIFDVCTKKNVDMAVENVLSASQVHGMIERKEIDIDIKYDLSSIKNYKLIEPGDYIVHLRSFQGGLAFSTKYGICSPAYTILRPKSSILYGFLENFFVSDSFIKSLKLVTYGIRDGRSINIEEFLKLPVDVPSIEKQTEILKITSILKEKLVYNTRLLHLYDVQKNWLLKALMV